MMSSVELPTHGGCHAVFHRCARPLVYISVQAAQAFEGIGKPKSMVNSKPFSVVVEEPGESLPLLCQHCPGKMLR